MCAYKEIYVTKKYVAHIKCRILKRVNGSLLSGITKIHFEFRSGELYELIYGCWSLVGI